MNKNPLSSAENWKGVWTALITPLSLQGKERIIDKKSLEQLLESQISQGLSSFVLGGSTGEGSLLSDKAFEDLLKSSRRIVGKRARLVAGLGIGGTQSCLKKLQIAQKAKMNGVLASPPAYIKTPQRLLEKHFLELASHKMPLCLYEIPGRAASSISLNLIEELCSSPKAKSIVAIKDATADMARISQEASQYSQRLALLSGDDGTFAPFLSHGGHGIISVASHFFPREYLKILELSQSKNNDKAQELQTELNPFVDLLFKESNPIPVKTLAKKLKWISRDVFCPPLAPLEKENLEELFLSFQKTKEKVTLYGSN